MSTPIMTRLDNVPSMPRFSRVFRITIVLESEIKAPNHSDGTHSQPSIRPMAKPYAVVKTICMGVPMMAILRTGFNSLKENSNPSANSRSATPISAIFSILRTSDTVTPPV